MFFREEGYTPGHNLRTLHLFRVMALEGLFCTETSFGKKALTHRIPQLLGTGIDLYEPYHVDYLELPRFKTRKCISTHEKDLKKRIQLAIGIGIWASQRAAPVFDLTSGAPLESAWKAYSHRFELAVCGLGS